MAERLELTQGQFHGRVSPSVVSLATFAKDLGISLDSLFTGRIDFIALSLHHSGSIDHMPERYTVGAFSRKRTSLGVLRYVESTFGWEKRRILLSQCQVNEASLGDPNGLVNIQLITDLVDGLGRFGFPDARLYSIGLSMVGSHEAKSLRSMIGEVRSVGEIFEKALVEHSGFWDFNFRYGLERLEDGLAVIRTTQNEDIATSLRTEHLASSKICAYKAGVFAAFPAVYGLPAAQVRELACVHRGDPKCLAVADFSHVQAAFNQPLH